MSQPHCVPELMTDCYAAADAGGTLLFVNAAAQRWLDPEATGQPLTGRPLREVLPPHCQLTALLEASAAPGDRTCGACGHLRLHVTPTGLELRGPARASTPRCALAEGRTQVVFGVGNIDAPLMFVGEAPGADEDTQGEPFVGAAGQLLTKIIVAMGLTREQVYIGNILKCRPDTPGQSAGNRKPTPEEMATCLPWLHQQIDLIRPRVLVALGATAVEGLLGKTIGITKLRGNWQTYRGIPLMPTYHPAYLLRNQSLATKREVWEDMLQAMEKLQMPISEKQRGFFLPKA